MQTQTHNHFAHSLQHKDIIGLRKSRSADSTEASSLLSSTHTSTTTTIDIKSTVRMKTNSSNDRQTELMEQRLMKNALVDAVLADFRDFESSPPRGVAPPTAAGEGGGRTDRRVRRTQSAAELYHRPEQPQPQMLFPQEKKVSEGNTSKRSFTLNPRKNTQDEVGDRAHEEEKTSAIVVPPTTYGTVSEEIQRHYDVEMPHPPRLSSDNSSGEEKEENRKSVSFVAVFIRFYPRILGENPSCTNGPSVSIGWDFKEMANPLDIDRFEELRHGNRRLPMEMVMPRNFREGLLRELGFSQMDIAISVRICQRIKNQRRQTVNNLGAQQLEETIERIMRAIKKVLLCQRKNNNLEY